MSILSQAITIILNGLQMGAIFALLGIGLTIILGTMKFLNLAHGALYVIGSYTGLIIATDVTLRNGVLFDMGFENIGLGLGFVPALFLVPLVVFIVGVLMERYVAEPFYGRPESDQLLVTFGLALIVEEMIKQIIGGNTFQPFAPKTIFGIQVSGPISLPIIGGFPRWRLVIVAIAYFVIFLTWYVIERTDYGLTVQAGTHDSEMVQLLGIPINRSYMLVFGMGAALAGFAGLIDASIQTLDPQIGTGRALIPAFLVIVVGGAGSMIGAIAGGLVLGLITAGFQQTFSQWTFIVMYIFVALVLVFRPEGLMGSVEVGE